MSDSLWPPWTEACQAPLSFSISWNLLKLMRIESVILTISSSATFFLQSFPASGSFPVSWLLASSSLLHTSFSGDRLSGLIFPYLQECSTAVIHTVKSMRPSNEGSRCSAFFMVQLSHPYMTNGENIALTMWTFVGKEMSLLFEYICIVCILPYN